MSDTTERPANRLAHESSPYLLQHQYNPVDWYPWGPEAFERAKREGRAVFISIGYSTCYWCHVMERESFENEAVAAEMNRRFVCIKVDREERPDVDQLYMTAVQVLTRHGGWPMSVFLTPDRRPFFGGTYFPAEDSPRSIGFVSLMEQIDDAWRQRPGDIEKTASELTEVLRRLAVPAKPGEPLVMDDSFIHSLIERSVGDFDPTHGGFGNAPKFPQQTLLMFLLAYLDEQRGPGTPDSELKMRLRPMLEKTLDAMAAGGIHDHLGGGFHRYSTDAQWLVPHFEIMLYDNALMAWIYTEAFRQTGHRAWADAARGILDFVLRDMTSDEGVFYTAIDAEVDGWEGRSYLWTPDEVRKVLDSASCKENDIQLFIDAYGLDGAPNFADPHHGSGKPDRWVLHRVGPIEAVAKLYNLSVQETQRRLSEMRQHLLEARNQRRQPAIDRKILTSWNALMIRALIHAGRVLAELRYTTAAERALKWLHTHHMAADGALLHASRPDRPGRQVTGFLDDYAGLSLALIDMQRAGTAVADTSGPSWRQWAEKLLDTITTRFASPSGGFYFTDQGADDLIVRQRVGADSPLPSGNGMAAMALLEAGRNEQADRVLSDFAGSMQRQGEGMSTLLEAVMYRLVKTGPLAVRAAAPNEVPTPRAPEPVSLSARWISPTRLSVTATIAAGFHLNSHEAPTGLIGTRLMAGTPYDTWIRAIEYPAGQEMSYSFHDQPMRVYAERVTFTIDFRAAPDVTAEPLPLTLHYQACTDSACLRPANVRLLVSTPIAG